MKGSIKPAVIILAFGGLGIVSALIEMLFYERGVLIDEFIIGGATISDLMSVTILVWLLVGAIIAILKS